MSSVNDTSTPILPPVHRWCAMYLVDGLRYPSNATMAGSKYGFTIMHIIHNTVCIVLDMLGKLRGHYMRWSHCTNSKNILKCRAQIDLMLPPGALIILLLMCSLSEPCQCPRLEIVPVDSTWLCQCIGHWLDRVWIGSFFSFSRTNVFQTWDCTDSFHCGLMLGVFCQRL